MIVHQDHGHNAEFGELGRLCRKYVADALEPPHEEVCGDQPLRRVGQELGQQVMIAAWLKAEVTKGYRTVLRKLGARLKENEMINPHEQEQQEPVKGDDYDLEEFICEACRDERVLPLVDVWKMADQDAIYHARAAKPDHDPDEAEVLVIDFIDDVPCCECHRPDYDKWMAKALTERGLPNGIAPTTVEVRAFPMPKEDIVPGQMYQMPETSEEVEEVYLAMFPMPSDEQLLKAETEYGRA